MRHQKPIPKESSFKSFSDNQAKDPRRNRSSDKKAGVSSKIRKMFNDREGSRRSAVGGRQTSDTRGQRSDSSSGSRGSYSSSGSRDSGARKSFSGKFDSKDSGSSRGSKDSGSRSNSYSRSNDRSDSRGSYSSGSRDSGSRSNSYSRGGRDSGSRNTFSGRNDSRGSDTRDSRDYRPKSFDRGDSRGSYSRGRDSGRDDTRNSDRKPSNGKHDRRTSRGKSFKEDRRNDAPREMHDAICQKCNKPCKVPFKPTQGKGVSCSNCFESKARNNDSQYGKKMGSFDSGAPRKRWEDVAPSMRGAERRSRDGIQGRGFTKDNDNGQRFAETKSGRKELFDAVCMKCKAKCKVPFKPTGKMGVSCTNCYNKNDSPFKGGKKKTGDRTHGQRINDSNKAAYGKKRY